MNSLLDRCIVCGLQAREPGAGICRYHWLMALIDLSLDRLRAALRGDIPTRGRRLTVSRENISRGKNV
jgi:hypothetical protein